MHLWEKLKHKLSHDDSPAQDLARPRGAEETDSIGSSTASLDLDSDSAHSTDWLEQPLVSPKKRRAATVVTFSTTISKPLKRSGQALQTAFTWGGNRAAAVLEQKIPKIVLDTPDGQTIYILGIGRE